MQVSIIYSIYDRKAQYYLPLFNARTDADAVRSFTQIVTQSETDIAKYPADFDLIRLGKIHLETGLIDREWPVGLVINGLVCLQNAHTERARYQSLLSNQQVDIEEIIAENP